MGLLPFSSLFPQRCTNALQEVMGKSILINNLKMSELGRSFEVIFPIQWFPIAHRTSWVRVIRGACYNTGSCLPLYLLSQHWGDAPLESIFLKYLW